MDNLLTFLGRWAALIETKRWVASTGAIPLDFTRLHAQAILGASPVRYVREARLRGSLFDEGDLTGLISAVDTGFFVDHEEPLDALHFVREEMDWPLGDLLDGHEFILIVQAKHRAGSRSRSVRRTDRANRIGRVVE